MLSKNKIFALCARLSTEMIAALITGVAIGRGFDYIFNIFPIATILFFFVGIGAGFLNIFRLFKKIEATHQVNDHKITDSK